MLYFSIVHTMYISKPLLFKKKFLILLANKKYKDIVPMKTMKITKSWSLRIMLLTVLLSGLSLNKVYSMRVQEDIDFRGDWTPNSTTRSVSFPVTASIDECALYIANSAPDCNMAITIIDYSTGNVVAEQIIPEAQTAFFAISIANLPAGTYMLKLTGQGGNKELYGIFSK